MQNRVDEFIKDPKKALFRFASPIIVAMIVQTLYNVVDTAFVGRLGYEAIAGLTFSFPIFFILISINSGISTGMNSLISRCMGQKNKQQAENTAMHALLLTIILSFIIFTIGIVTLKPILILFGASNLVLKYSYDYMSIILIGIFFMFPSFAFNTILSAQGDTKTPTKIQITALTLNIILDYLFIFKFNMGVRGAAIATVIAFILSLILGMIAVRRKSYLHIHKSSFRYSSGIIKEIFFIGMPATIMLLLMSFYIIFLNKFMDYFGTEYVAAFGIASRLESVAMLPIIGLSVATLTLIGMFFGAKRNDLIKFMTGYSIKIGIIMVSIVGVLFFVFPSYFLRIFTPETSLIAIGIPYLRIDVFTFPLMAISVITSRIMQGIGLGMPGLIIQLVRIFFVAIPIAYLFVYVLDYNYLSIVIAMIFGNLVAVIVSFIWLRIKVYSLNEK